MEWFKRANPMSPTNYGDTVRYQQNMVTALNTTIVTTNYYVIL